MFPNYSPPFFEQIYLEEMPSEWRWVDITNISKPKQWETISQSSFTDNGYPVYGANGKVGFYSNYNHEDSVIAISCRGACGDLHLTEPFSYVSGNAMCLDDLSEDIEQKFLFYTLSYRGLKDTISGSAQPQITRENLKGVFFPLPPLPEQKKIASILTSVDEVIEKTQSQIEKLQDLKKGTMNELLTKGIGHTEFKDSELGRIPKSWKVTSLLETAKNGISNGVFNDPKKQGGDYRLINVYDMYQGFGINVQRLTRLELSDKEFQKNKVEYGDIFLTRSSLKLEGIAHCNICLSEASDLTYDGHLMKVIPNKSLVEPIFLALQCLSDMGRIFLMRMAKQSTMTTIGQEDIAPLPIALPTLEEQREVINVHNSFEIRLEKLKTKLAQTQSLKKSLMQDLLTGKVRVQVGVS